MHHRTVLFVLAELDESVFGKVDGVDILDRDVVVLVGFLHGTIYFLGIFSF